MVICGQVDIARLGCLFRTCGCTDEKIFYQAVLFTNQTVVVLNWWICICEQVDLLPHPFLIISSVVHGLLNNIIFSHHIESSYLLVYLFFIWYPCLFPGIESVYWWEGKVCFYNSIYTFLARIICNACCSFIIFTTNTFTWGVLPIHYKSTDV